MPIRIEDDNPNQGGGGRRRRPTNDNRGGGGGGLIAFLPLLFNLVRKNPKIGIPLIIIAGLFMLLRGGCGGCGSMIGDNETLPFSTGGNYDAQKYSNTEIYEPLADNKKNPLPEKVSLLQYAPQRLNQGRQGSCVGWASAYAARTILHTKATGQRPDPAAFSPAYLYNQIKLPNCQGAYLPDAMKAMQSTGALPLSDFGYDESSCSDEPNSSEVRQGQKYNIRGSQRLTLGNKLRTDMLAIKQNLAAGGPVVIGMQVGGSFMRAMEGQSLWTPSSSDYTKRGFSGHAMCVIGYDDYYTQQEGAFQIMNSWGKNWGDNGVAWVRYSDFDEFVREAYGLYPMGDSRQAAENFAVEFGIMEVDIDKGKILGNVPFRKAGDYTFRTTRPMQKRQKFKIEVTNSIECYTYVFGEETDGSVYTLFPYDEKHSPFCGITGTRLFPRDKSLYPDEKGSVDRMAIVVTKAPLDYTKLNNLFNQVSGSMEERLVKVLGNDLLQSPSFRDGQTVSFSGSARGKNAMFVVLEIDK